MGSAEYYLRITILPRVIVSKTTSGEDVEGWPDTGTQTHYSAKTLSLNAGEEIRQGVKEATEFLKLEIRGRNIPVNAVDRVKLVVSGRLFRITAQPVRNRKTTILSCESIPPDTQ